MSNFPLRTCIACRIIKPQSELIRLVLDSKNQVVIDKNRKENRLARRSLGVGGRGTYVCNENCLKKAIEENLFGRAFRKRVEISNLLKEFHAF